MDRKILRKYGKSMSGVLSLKRSFFSDNDKLLENSEQFKRIYVKQPVRTACKICGQPMPPKPYYICHGTPFYLCESCGHLNGKYEDGEQYTEALYSSGLYGETYYEENPLRYVRRTESIYIPKVQFLIDALAAEKENYQDLRYFDVGTGAGYMVSAYDRLLLNAQGIDVNKSEIEYGNKMLGKGRLSVVEPAMITQMLACTDCEAVSFMGVWEHMFNLTEVLAALRDNPKIKYIYFSVPKFSLSCVFEIVFPEVFPRQMGGGGGHTHLFTDRSIEWICNKYQFTPIAKWQFGTDIMDLYRSLSVMLEKSNASDQLLSDVSALFIEQADALQMIIDKTSLASETHIVLKKPAL